VKIIEDHWRVGGEGSTAPGDAAVYLVRFGIYKGRENVQKFIRRYLD
jgi:hypothetical protein